MEAATAVPEMTETDIATEQEEVETPVETSPATERHPSKLFRYSGYVHVGEGADECPGGEDGSCVLADHFHAWTRLPNQFQVDSIRQKALAAKARKVRQLRDPESDGAAILDANLDLMRGAHDAHELLTDELVAREFLNHHREAAIEVNSEEEFETITEDLERMRVLDAQDPEERNHDEFKELQTHIGSYHNRIEAVRTEKERPLRDALSQKSVDELIAMIRDERIEQESNQEFMRAYSTWEWFVCTLKPRDPKQGQPKERVWPDINVMLADAPEVLEAIDIAFSDLEGALNESGNS